MPVSISPYHVRRSCWIDAPPEVVWGEFTSFERMRAWYGTGHTLTEYEPRVGGTVETTVTHEGTPIRFRGEVLAFEPCSEISFEQLWLDSDADGPTMVTIRLTGIDSGTMFELFHHGYERVGGDIAEQLDGYEEGWTNRQMHALRELVRA